VKAVSQLGPGPKSPGQVTTTIPLSKSAVQITTRAAPACSPVAAERIALRQAAAETIRRGYDRFVIVNANAQTNIQQISAYSNGVPIYAGSHDQKFTIEMFRDGDTNGKNAISAREQLGPDWKKEANEDQTSCLD
jgi:hypothetical protein